MKISLSPDQQELAIKTGGGVVLTLFGLFFGGMPLVMMIVILSGVEMEGNMGPTGALLFLSVFVIIGLSVMGGRRGIILDKRSEEIRSWFGIFVPFKQSHKGYLNDCERVTIHKEIRRSSSSNGGSRTYTVYATRIEIGQHDSIDVSEPRTEAEARRLAESLAKFLHVPLYDASVHPAIERKPELLDETVAEQWLRRQADGEIVPSIQEPIDSKVKVSSLANHIEIGIPSPNILGGVIIFAFMTIIPLFMVGSFLSFPGGEGPPLGFKLLVFGMMVGMPGIFGFFNFILPGLRKGKIILDRKRIRVNGYGTGVSIPLNELEELVIIDSGADVKKDLVGKFMGRGTGLRVASDKKTLSFARHLSEEECRYIHAVLIQQIVDYSPR